MKQVFGVLILLFSFSSVYAETPATEPTETSSDDSFSFLDGKWLEELDLHYDWDLLDGKGFTPRYAWLDDENFIGNAHYFGVGYYHKAGAESEGVTLRAAIGSKGEKLNLAYSNSFSFMAVDIGLSYYFLDDGNRPELEYEELLGLELGLRFWVIQFVAVHTESTSFITLGYGF